MFGLFNKQTTNENLYTLRNDYRTRNDNSDERIAADNGSIVTRKGNVKVLDGGAIEKSFDFAGNMAQMAHDDTELALTFADNAFDAAHSAVTGQSERILTLAEEAMARDRAESARLSSQALQIAVPLGLAIAAAWAWSKSK